MARSWYLLIPLLPYIIEEEIEDIIKEVKSYNAQYFLYKNLELKGDQKQMFFSILKNYYPHYLEKYEKLFMEEYKPNQKNLKKFMMKFKLYVKNIIFLQKLKNKKRRKIV